MIRAYLDSAQLLPEDPAMGDDKKLPQDPLLDPVFEDLTKGQKSVYDIPAEAVDTKSWIGKKQADAPESTKPKVLEVIPNKVELNSVVPSYRPNDSIQQPLQTHKGPFMPDSPTNPEDAFQEWNYYFDKAERANYWSARKVRTMFNSLNGVIWLLVSSVLLVATIALAIFRVHL
jgi:hypothetical protein